MEKTKEYYRIKSQVWFAAYWVITAVLLRQFFVYIRDIQFSHPERAYEATLYMFIPFLLLFLLIRALGSFAKMDRMNKIFYSLFTLCSIGYLGLHLYRWGIGELSNIVMDSYRLSCVFMLGYFIIKLAQEISFKKFTILIAVMATVFFLAYSFLVIIRFVPPPRPLAQMHYFSGPNFDEIEVARHQANYCSSANDCQIITGPGPWSCGMLVNKNEANRIINLLYSYKGTGDAMCYGGSVSIACEGGKCAFKI